ncbi:methyltransferase domain-containing protein [Flavobacterium sp.]|uniref:methyltransferase domain-containing protein n=1 Tax=Flavobacterium sp. TaxID=239 RepID=UPI0035B46776
MEDLQCCVTSCEKPLDQAYWDAQYKAKATGWDLGTVSPPIQALIDTIEDKNSAILIPGGGNSYEAEYLLQQGFTNITVIDIAPTLIEVLQQKFVNHPNVKIILGDFFEHQGQYDWIIEQTFFCALPPTMRPKYVWKMHQLLAPKGKLVGLLFNREFEQGPPFGGNKVEYINLFSGAFTIEKMEVCTNSVAPRADAELIIEFKKNAEAKVHLYEFEGITCSGCKATVSEKLASLDTVLNVTMNSNFSEVVIASTQEVALRKLQDTVSFDEKYKIIKANY